MRSTMVADRTDRKSERGGNDPASSGSVVVTSDRPTLNAGAPERSANVVQALADFGVPKSKRGARLHVVLSAPSASRTGREHRIENMAPESWRPRHACTMSMDRALREMEFPSRLAGAEWVVGE